MAPMRVLVSGSHGLIGTSLVRTLRTRGDEVGAILHALTHDTVRGPLNATAPNPVTNTEFTRILGAALGPEMARETLLVSQRVRPARLEATGYEFHHPELPGALEAALGR